MQSGGTRILVRIRSTGRPLSMDIPSRGRSCNATKFDTAHHSVDCKAELRTLSASDNPLYQGLM